MKRLLASMLLGVAVPNLTAAQAGAYAPTPAAIAGARQKLIKLQQEALMARDRLPFAWQQPKACEPGPVQTVLDIPGGWCEGTAVAQNGDIYTSDQVTFNVYRITPSGESSLFAHLYDMYNPDAAYAGALGMAFARNGDLWIAMLNFMEPARHGLYRVSPDGRFELAVAMNPDEIVAPNGLAFDPHGDLYITECINGGIWKVVNGQNTATLWLVHDLLAPPATGVFGANGIVYKDGALFVANTDQGTILKVPVGRDGSPGEPTVLTSGLNGPDGLTLGPDGELYAACCYGGQLARITEDGAVEVVLGAGLGYPTTPVFGKARSGRRTVFLTNFLSSMNGLPSLIKVELCPSSQGDSDD